MPASVQTSIARKWPLIAVASLLALGAVLWGARPAASRDEVTALLTTSKTILDQPISYPTKGPAKITAAIVVMQPGEETGWHKHDVPLFGYILEGEVTVDYGAQGTRVYRAGDAVMEAIDLAHNGRNSGKGVARLLAVFMGAEGVANTVMVAPPR
jgi:quercetin dioxygenase-like cupin family protein